MIRLDPQGRAIGIARGALGAPGRRQVGPMEWAARGGALFAFLAGAWLAFAALRPLPGAERPAHETIPQTPTLAPSASPPSDRRELLAAMGQVNLFDAEREMWSRRAPSEPKSAAADAKPEVKPPPAGSEAMAVGGQTVQVTKPAALPEDVKQALTGLALRGVYSVTNDGSYTALISRVHNGTNPMLSDPFRVGDEFEDKQHPQAKWKIIAIDGPARRIVLQRGGINAVLEMYTATSAAAAAAKPAESAAPAKPSTSIVLQTREEIEASLRAAKFTDEEIGRLLELAAMEPDQAAAAAALAAIARSEKDAASPDKPTKRPPPAGLEAIAKLLQTPPKQVEEGSSPPPDEQPKP